MPRASRRHRARSRSTSWSTSDDDTKRSSRKRRHASRSRSPSSDSSKASQPSNGDVPPSKEMLLARVSGGLKSRPDLAAATAVSDQDLIHAAVEQESVANSAATDSQQPHDDCSLLPDDTYGQGDIDEDDHENNEVNEDIDADDVHLDENQALGELLDDGVEAQRVDCAKRPPADTPEEALERAKANRGAIISPQVKEWVRKHQNAHRMAGLVRRAFRQKYGRTGNILIDTPPRRDDEFSDKGTWGLAHAKNKDGFIAIQPSAFKLLSDKLFRLHDTVTESARIAYQLGDLLGSIKQLEPSEVSDEMKTEAITHAFNSCNWAATYNADITHQLAAIRRYANVMPFCRNKSALQLKSIYEDLDAEGINFRASREIGNFPSSELAPPLLYGRALKKRLHSKFKDRRKAENVIGDLLGNDRAQSSQQRRAPSRVNSAPGNFQRSFPRQFAAQRPNFRNFGFSNRVSVNRAAFRLSKIGENITAKKIYKASLDIPYCLDASIFHEISAPDPPKVSGRISFALSNWKIITSDPWILKIVNGAELGLFKEPFQAKPLLPLHFDEEHSKVIDDRVDEMILKDAISEIPHEQARFVCRIFTVTQKSGKIRPILDLSPLNKFIHAPKFKMETINSLRTVIKPADYMGKIDLSDAYFTIPIRKDQQPFLQFFWNARLFQFSCLPFGLSTAPFIFTKLLAPVVAFWRARGIRCLIYLDDIIVMAASHDVLSHQLEFCIQTLKALGFFVNRDKCQLDPSNSIEYLGLIVNSISMTFHVPILKQKEVMERAERILVADTVSLKVLASFLGYINFLSTALEPGAAFCRELQFVLIDGLAEKKSFHHQVALPYEARHELFKWLHEMRSWDGRSINPPKIDVVMACDASNSGWGAIIDDGREHGFWSANQRNLHINVRELLAVRFGLRAYADKVNGKNVLIQTDNTTVMSYINRRGGTRSRLLSRISSKLWLYCLQHNISLVAQHIPGMYNILADKASRFKLDPSDWKLNPEIFAQLNEMFGPFQCDLFAADHNKQCDCFCSRISHPDAFAIDAFSIFWNQFSIAYAYPPICLIGDVLRKIWLNQATVLLIAPMWQRKFWYPILLDMCIMVPILLPTSAQLISRPDVEPGASADDAMLVRLVEAYCGAAPSASYGANAPNSGFNTPGIHAADMSSSVLPGANHNDNYVATLLAEDEKIFVEELVDGNVVFQEKSLVDTVYAMRDQIKEMNNEITSLRKSVEREQRQRRKLEEVIRKQQL